ncbi:hydantoinase/oxoprolinase N-terminal domain-containing protein [Flavimaricola marinus]|uniref:Acetophenone carboxylase gamma subunit n=1 Tax=Flavimaricola marinus TaxID=1819565 RepID=A0A238LAT2_9RHOB|nr:hydantoinase/oxoprolinase family protein [Flavimaricola marinus]SMY06535.1 Acetophenone carboxylase gamma subunit [Flavimaricola marinus]
MPILLGIDTGGTYTDAVLIDEAEDRVLASAKALTSRPDLSIGVAAAIDAVLAEAEVSPIDVAMVSLSTTLATNALVEGQGGRVALVFIGFDPAELARDGLEEALKGDPVIQLPGGHTHAGTEVAPLDLAALEAALEGLGPEISGFAVAARFATRNPAHEIAARDLIRARMARPVTCSHELSSALGGPKRALTAVLNARLIGMIDGLIGACEGNLAKRGIDARLMVVRGDGALVSAGLARERPIETILSGPAASIAGASWLTGETDALVSDIGGTTTDVCLLRDGRPMIDPEGARVGPHRTMVEAVAMRTTGLGGDSEVHLLEGLEGGLRLGPRRLMPVSLLATTHAEMVHRVLDRALATEIAGDGAGRFAVPLWSALPTGLDKREAAVAERLADGPQPLAELIRNRVEAPALGRLVSRGQAVIAGVTPSDAAHVLGYVQEWDTQAAEKALALFARKRSGRGDRIAEGAGQMAQMIVDQLTAQTVACLLEAAFAEDGRDWGGAPAAMAAHGLTRAGLDRHRGVIETELRLGVPVIGLGASAGSYYGAVGTRLGTRMVLPAHAGVANAIGAVVGQVSMVATGTVSGAGCGSFVVHLASGPLRLTDRDEALAALEAALSADASARARSAGVEEVRLTVSREINEVEVEGQPMFIDATLRVTAQGRPRIARDHAD